MSKQSVSKQKYERTTDESPHHDDASIHTAVFIRGFFVRNKVTEVVRCLKGCHLGRQTLSANVLSPISHIAGVRTVISDRCHETKKF